MPPPTLVQLPSVLNFPAPKLLGYSRESVIAEKFHTMTRLGEINSRLKDFYDVWLLATSFDFDGAVLALAIGETFARRQTALPNVTALLSVFAQDQAKQTAWETFTRRHRAQGAPATLREVVTTITGLLQPAVSALVEGKPFNQRWPAGGPWQA